jgi:hypothetical protein
MPRRRPKRNLKSVRIDEVAHGHLSELQEALGAQDLPTYVTDVDILSSLVLFTPAEQLAGMLRAYWRSTGNPHSQETVGED